MATTSNKPDLEALRSAVAARPSDLSARESLARALEASGAVAESVRVMTDGVVNLTGHTTGPLPCNCRRCIEPEAQRAEANGIRFVRDFSSAKGRVLYYWVPESMVRSRKEIARSVHDRLQSRLKDLSKGKA